nr:thymidine kinase, cytosolic isoform X1 [Dasypus novemcinctus]
MPGKAAAQPVEAHWSGSPGPLEIKLEFQRKRPFRQALVCLVILPCKYRWPLPLVSPASSVLFLKRQEHKRAPKSSQRVHRKLKCVFQRAKGLPCQVFVFGEETGSGRLTRRTGASRPGFSPRGEWTALRARVELATSWFPDIVEFSEAMANAGKTVIVAALDGTFQRKAFGNILNLVPLAESVVKLTAVCMGCFREASYTKRLGAETEVAPACLLPLGPGWGTGGPRPFPADPSVPPRPGRGHRRSRQVPVRVPPLLLQEGRGAASRAGQQRELPGAGKARGGRGGPEALCPSPDPAVQPGQLRGEARPPPWPQLPPGVGPPATGRLASEEEVGAAEVSLRLRDFLVRGVLSRAGRVHVMALLSSPPSPSHLLLWPGGGEPHALVTSGPLASSPFAAGPLSFCSCGESWEVFPHPQSLVPHRPPACLGWPLFPTEAPQLPSGPTFSGTVVSFV